MARKVSVLDCTIRDGGYALEGIAGKKIDNVGFTENIIRTLAEAISDIGTEIVEVGRVDYPNPDNGILSAAFEDIESVSKVIPQKRKEGQQFSFMFRGPDMPLDMIPQYKEGLCEIIRICIRYSEFAYTLDYAEALVKKGYKVSIQGAVTMRYSEQELELLIKRANEIGVYAVYIVDTYGYMTPMDVERLFELYDSKLNSNIILGFHAHNNLDSAFLNVSAFLDCADKSEREILIDSCCMGMGQSAGNMQTEILGPYLNQRYGKNYNFIKNMRACDIVEKYFYHDNIWGYSLSNVIAAHYKIAYGYSMVLRREYGMTAERTAIILSNVPKEMIYRYSKENLEWIMEQSGCMGKKDYNESKRIYSKKA